MTIILFPVNDLSNLIDEGEFYEHAKIFENYYGTLKKNVDETIDSTRILFLTSIGGGQNNNYLNLITLELNKDLLHTLVGKNELKRRLY